MFHDANIEIRARWDRVQLWKCEQQETCHQEMNFMKMQYIMSSTQLRCFEEVI